MPFTGLDLIRFFVLSGAMCFVAEVGDDVDLAVGGRPKQKQRLKVVFDNGTEPAMYKQSLMTRIYEAQGHPGEIVDHVYDPTAQRLVQR